jgi:hypothetical protein
MHHLLKTHAGYLSLAVLSLTYPLIKAAAGYSFVNCSIIYLLLSSSLSKSLLNRSGKKKILSMANIINSLTIITTHTDLPQDGMFLKPSL